MTGIIKSICEEGKLKLFDVLFIVFCMFPFIIPNPIVATNLQPYAAMLGTVIIIRELWSQKDIRWILNIRFFLVSGITLIISLFVIFVAAITITSFRAIFNYYSVAVIPAAFYLILCRIEAVPEKLLKTLIVIWFVVASIQFFIDRGFLTGIIGGVRFSYSYRGVVGLASEPSFLGIACFYFLHMVTKFRKNQLLFIGMILIMGVLYAQSMMGIMFIGAFALVYLIDMVNVKNGRYVWIGAIFALVVFVVLLNTVLVGTRLHKLFELFFQEGFTGILNDASVNARFDSLIKSVSDSFQNFLLPLGYIKRIGSGYGGFLCELGIFALPILWCISRVMSRTFKKKASQITYFIVVTILLFNNTQLGNPLLLVVIALNLYLPCEAEHKKGEICDCN